MTDRRQCECGCDAVRLAEARALFDCWTAAAKAVDAEAGAIVMAALNVLAIEAAGVANDDEHLQKIIEAIGGDLRRAIQHHWLRRRPAGGNA